MSAASGLTALSNNNFALAIANRNAADDVINLYILISACAQVNFATIDPGTELNAVEVVALTGGGFAITWQNLNSNTINYAVYSNTAAVVRGPTHFGAFGGQNEPSVAALADGGFVIVWDDDTNSDIRGQRFSADGTQRRYRVRHRHNRRAIRAKRHRP